MSKQTLESYFNQYINHLYECDDILNKDHVDAAVDLLSHLRERYPDMSYPLVRFNYDWSEEYSSASEIIFYWSENKEHSFAITFLSGDWVGNFDYHITYTSAKDVSNRGAYRYLKYKQNGAITQFYSLFEVFGYYMSYAND